tara:strand:- start:1935 stop:2609 length:675 start_codon:yes stop_codon:yes gene_type:complete
MPEESHMETEEQAIYDAMRELQPSGNIQVDAPKQPTETVIPPGRVTDSAIIEPDRMSDYVQGVEAAPEGDAGQPVHYVKTQPNRMGIQLTIRDENGTEGAMMYTGGGFEPADEPPVPDRPFSARRMDAFGDAEIRQIIKYRNDGMKIHLYRADLPEGVMAIQAHGGPIDPDIVILVQKYQAWEQDVNWSVIANITDASPWAFGGGKLLEIHMKQFLKAVRRDLG